ncbi:MAG TPA: SGNH/GDSL hydrolase family protein, partial [Flavobacterium sp.]|nr:SGNH/GDSL hydrolase family protein [Flavobacterium sp.]
SAKRGNVNFIIGKDTLRKNLVPNNLVNSLKVTSGSIKAFKANFVHADSIPIYGFNFDNGSGVHVDNFSQRGNSGLPISMFDADVMRAFNNNLKYDLVVLHYGTNVLNYGTKNYYWYEKGMKKAVNKIKESFPGVSILIVSTADKSTKYDLEMKTDSAVVPLMKAQKRYALESESGFVNLYTLMGGDGSMVKWVDETPARANKDYTHFNQRGAKAIGRLLYDQLNKGYEEYKILREKRDAVSRQQRAARKTNTDSVSVQKDSVNE